MRERSEKSSVAFRYLGGNLNVKMSVLRLQAADLIVAKAENCFVLDSTDRNDACEKDCMDEGLLSQTEPAEYPVQEILMGGVADDFPKGLQPPLEIHSDNIERQIGLEILGRHFQ